MLKVALIVVVVLVLLLGLPLGVPMSGGSMCPDCDLGTWSVICIALIASIVFLLPLRARGVLSDHARKPLLVTVDAFERPPRPS